MQNTLPKALRGQLESTVRAARDVAEKAALAALHQMGVGDGKLPEHLDDDGKSLRRRLRAHGRCLGDVKNSDESQDLTHLKWEVAYEHWHRMLFARFLAENNLLLWEPGAPVTLAECEELAQDSSTNLGTRSGWELAGKLAARMLPQVFKPNSPVFELRFSPNEQRDLENLLKALPTQTFQASDSLGWVYQFWQAKRKDEVNASEVKIGADELPAVTQLFTEPYMVDFLLHNSVGAWWVTRHPGKTCPVPLTYLRTLEDGTPAAGKFEGWPDKLQDFKLLDPCCGSGHFLVAAFLMLVPMRMAADGLSASAAVDSVLGQNLHGLELDARCVEIAVFALALAAWRFLDENGDPLGVRTDMPAPQVACCGLKVAAKPEDWMALVPDDVPNAVFLRQELRLLHASFAQAPLLGSLLDPARSLKNDLATSCFGTLRDLLGRALATERPAALWGHAGELQDDAWDLALTAKGLLDVARLLDSRYHLVVTNVPYLGRGKQHQVLMDYCERHYPEAKSDLATVFLERCAELAAEAGVGTVQVVMPQNWLFLSSYRKQRELLLVNHQWKLLAKLGSGAFETISGEVVNVILLTLDANFVNSGNTISGIDVSPAVGSSAKSAAMRTSSIIRVSQSAQLKHPDARVALESLVGVGGLLSASADAYQGLITGDRNSFIFGFWEVSLSPDWDFYVDGFSGEGLPLGREQVIRWQHGKGRLSKFASENRDRLHDMHESGQLNWGRKGVALTRIGLRATPYFGEKFDNNLITIVPKNISDIEALWSYCCSVEYKSRIRALDQKLSLTNATATKVNVNLSDWQGVNSFPEPHSNDPSQWLFHGHPIDGTDPLQVTVARLLGFKWPAETDARIELSDQARMWTARCDALATMADDDGIVCLPSVRGEPAAHDRLLKLLIAAWETVQPGSWKPAVLDKLLADADCTGKGLDVWLRDKFFEQHSKRFHHRPFIWHVWDGLKDGFAALVNYHQLDAKNLERLIHTYLGDWIRQQEAGIRDGVDGAQTRLAAAQDLKRRLELILEGEKPYDIFVRWKPLSEQPIGWNPDLNDGVRLNIRPFMAAEVLRHNKKPKLNITWDKDRGKDVETSPWFKFFQGERINDHHLSLDEKRRSHG